MLFLKARKEKENFMFSDRRARQWETCPEPGTKGLAEVTPARAVHVCFLNICRDPISKFL